MNPEHCISYAHKYHRDQVHYVPIIYYKNGINERSYDYYFLVLGQNRL